MKTAAIVIIGDEVLSGRTQDANMNTLAKRMTEIGIALKEARFVADDSPAIIHAVNTLREQFDYVFTSGGIGPTHDDITADAIAQAFGVTINIRDDARLILERFYKDRLNEARLRMARIPEGATLIDNPVSQAPGFKMGNVYVMAGVPMVFNAMLDSVVPTLEGSPPLKSYSLRVAIGEGDMGTALGALDQRHPDVQIGSYPFFKSSGNGVTIVARSIDEQALDVCVDDLRDLLRELGATDIQETKM